MNYFKPFLLLGSLLFTIGNAQADPNCVTPDTATTTPQLVGDSLFVGINEGDIFHVGPNAAGEIGAIVPQFLDAAFYEGATGHPGNSIIIWPGLGTMFWPGLGTMLTQAGLIGPWPGWGTMLTAGDPKMSFVHFGDVTLQCGAPANSAAVCGVAMSAIKADDEDYYLQAICTDHASGTTNGCGWGTADDDFSYGSTGVGPICGY